MIDKARVFMQSRKIDWLEKLNADDERSAIIMTVDTETADWDSPAILYSLVLLELRLVTRSL